MTDDGAAARIAALGWMALGVQLEERSVAIAPALLTPAECHAVRELYPKADLFRSTVTMARHGFGRGEYRYFAYDLPLLVAELRTPLYPPLAAIAADWSKRLGLAVTWPATHAALLDRCRAAGQTRPTPLLLRYGAGDFNCLHQDLYGEIHFPLQAAILLDEPGVDFQGGAFVLVETRPRQQSRCEVAALRQGDLVIFPVRDRPRQGAKGVYRTQLRHGVSTITQGQRHTLGIIFHDAR
ncbi:2OG-Fe(II) oxygenase [Sphingomonas sp. RT2P30]|uniref:2OG-Fe(II) oxygenase n=1 Tax=Parasphingomonas halimpatiens TaxID=3096162 RepID=UPI002FC5B8F1